MSKRWIYSDLKADDGEGNLGFRASVGFNTDEAARNFRQKLSAEGAYAYTYDGAQTFFLSRDEDTRELAIFGIMQRVEDSEPDPPKFTVGDRVRKIKGSSWTGKIVGTYATDLTPEGYAVESVNEPGSVQIYPAAALEAVIVDE